MNLLIVEDDVRLASALAHILEEAGHAVDTANDGELATPTRLRENTTSRFST